jgi:S1-C subfamily serine protease
MKKLKRKLLKKLERSKQYVKDQLFYAKKLIPHAISGLFSGLRMTIICVSIGSGVLLTGLAHTKYIEHKVGSNTVFISSSPDAPLQGRATGFEIKARSGKVFTVTNAHVCELKDKNNNVMILEKQFSGRLIPKKVIEVYPDNDLCIVEGLDGYEGLELGSAPSIGDYVTSIGYPLGGPLDVTRGRIKDFSAVKIAQEDIPLNKCVGPRLSLDTVTIFIFRITVCVKSFNAMNTNVTTYPGNSGSPLVNFFGNVVGVIFASNGGTHWGSAVPFEDLENLLRAY